MDTSPVHPLDYLSVLRRRKWWLIAPMALAVVVGAALAAFLPWKYQSTATLGISIPNMGGQVVSDGSRLTPQDRTRNINQVLLSPVVLERVVTAEGLAGQMSMDAAVSTLANATRVRLPPPDWGTVPGIVEMFYVDFTDGSPERAQRVANRLAEVFIEEASRKRTVRAEQTATFIDDQLAVSQARLNDLEARLRVAKEAHMGALPEQTQTNVQMVTGLQQQLATTVNSLRGEQERLQWIEREISGARPTLAPSGTGPMIVSISPAAQRVASLQRDLATAQTIYKDKHPDVQNLQRELALAQAAAADDASRPEAEREQALRVDPEYRALLAEREQSRLHIADLQRTQVAIQQQIGRYTARVESAPRVEQQVASRQREYDLEKQQYAALTAKLRDAEMAENVERSQGGEQFALLGRAPFPTKPSSPNIPRLMLITGMLGICLGGSLALGREYLDRSIHEARGLNDLDLPVLGEIPRISHV